MLERVPSDAELNYHTALPSARTLQREARQDTQGQDKQGDEEAAGLKRVASVAERVLEAGSLRAHVSLLDSDLQTHNCNSNVHSGICTCTNPRACVACRMHLRPEHNNKMFTTAEGRIGSQNGGRRECSRAKVDRKSSGLPCQRGGILWPPCDCRSWPSSLEKHETHKHTQAHTNTHTHERRNSYTRLLLKT